MIITGSLDDLVSKVGTSVKSFATLSTDEIFCENVSNGYNSSVMLFSKERTRHLYDILNRYYSHVMKFLMRFDHYLEMLVWNAELVQQVVPGHLIDYSQHFRVNKGTELPPDCRIVAFPRNPKPHEIEDSWAAEHWVYEANT